MKLSERIKFLLLINNLLKLKNMKNWKTSITGIATAVAYIGYKLLTHQLISFEDVTLALGMIGLGAVSKDHNVTGNGK